MPCPAVVSRVPLQCLDSDADSGPMEHPADASVTSDRAQISISSQGTPESRADIPNKRPERKATSATPDPPGPASVLRKATCSSAATAAATW
ncbi:MAG: hypothetical protein QOH52_972 [Pseudonocardiales bacterium]|nr:hypothetical protein [Pseudonocardiales bacterium]